ncbi:MAG TPA: TonB-dependent receptor plug domain-containing protein [Lacipirellulaceae bacterium]|nr:TonB-dependent receptor plug domain-containing protein [Lacipirellulaceae bacterium]
MRSNSITIAVAAVAWLLGPACVGRPRAAAQPYFETPPAIETAAPPSDPASPSPSAPAAGEIPQPLPDPDADAAETDPAADPSANADDLDSLLDAADQDIAQLGRVNVAAAPSLAAEVTSVSRQVSTVGQSPAAVFVITQEMIQRSGANNLPDLLRLAPGIEVARIEANKWAITSRGFNSLYAKYLLVQIDGRAVYTQFFSGVVWDLQDVVLQDIERIEVVRGPGATVWGANAVNGVINIITKKAAETQGVLATGGTGTEERGFSTFRYGGQAGQDLHWRIYGKQFERDGGYFFGDDFDDWRQARGGFRADWTPTPDDLITAQGDMFDGDSGEGKFVSFPGFPFIAPQTFDNHERGQNAVLRWSHAIDADSDWSVQTYYDRWARTYPFADLQQETFDVDAQYRFPMGDRHNVICGASYRHIDDYFFGDFDVSVDPVARNTNLFGCFIQDEISLSEDLWSLIVGSKFEHNDFTGFEYQPSVRLLHTPDQRRTVWAAVSRAVRTPNRFDEDLTLNQFVAPGPTFVRISGNRGIEAEDLLAFELGYRAQPTERFSWDLATFYNDYSDLHGPIATGAPFFDPSIPGVVVPQTLDNVFTADTYGAELASTLQVRPDWRLSGAYTLLYIDMHASPTDFTQGSSPRNQANLRSSWNLRPDLDLDLIGRYVDSLPALGVHSYLTMDARLAWRPWHDFEWAVVGRNLLDDRHAEFRDTFSGIISTEVQSEVFTTLTWKM